MPDQLKTPEREPTAGLAVDACSAQGATATPRTDAKIVMLSQGPFFVEAVPSAFARELEMHAAAVRHARDYWADRAAAAEAGENVQSEPRGSNQSKT